MENCSDVVESTKSESESEYESESSGFESESESLKIWTRVRLEYAVGLEYYITGKLFMQWVDRMQSFV